MALNIHSTFSEISDIIKVEEGKPTEQKPVVQCGLEDPVIEDEVKCRTIIAISVKA